MSEGFKFKALSLICGLLLLATITTAQNNSDKLNFPEVEGWEKSETVVYPTKDLGYSVAYKSEEGGTVSIYVYDSGLKKIDDGIENKNVKNQLKKAEEEIKTISKAGYYDDVQLIKSETIKPIDGVNGKVKTLYSLLSF